MAIFSNIETIKNQVNRAKFKVAINYLQEALTCKTDINERLLSLNEGSFVRVDLDKNNFALEQVYVSKNRDECFFESHKKYIDVQCIVEGEEIIEVTNVNNLAVAMNYDKELDLIKYGDIDQSSSIILKKGDIAIFYPEDAHMPCIKLNDFSKVVKTVVKVAV